MVKGKESYRNRPKYIYVVGAEEDCKKVDQINIKINTDHIYGQSDFAHDAACFQILTTMRLTHPKGQWYY